MPDALAIVTRIISEHHAIKEHVRLARDTVNDIEALLTLQGAQTGWTQASITALIEKRDQLLQAISFLQQGLRNHFDFEEQSLVPLLGELVAQAVVREHNRISKQINEAKSIVADMHLEGLDQRELISNKSLIEQHVDSLRRVVEEHTLHEEAILKMMKDVLEANKA
jgi:hypothetical protein